MAQALRLMKYVTFGGVMACKTGLRIGGTEAGMEIGGAENPVIKDAQGVPYIPGSSLKGKLRSVLEYKYNRIGDAGQPCGCGQKDCPVCPIFGPHRNPRHDLGPSRIIVRDAYLSDSSRKIWDQLKKEGKDFTETKTETMVDRRTGVAATGSLRTQERVPAGTEFQLNISLRIFEGDDEVKMKALVREGLDLLQKDYLGGSGTRGYGWVEVRDLKME